MRDDGLQIQPVSRLDVLLYTASGRFIGVLGAAAQPAARARTASGSPGRGPTSARSPPGGYELRLAAWPTLPRDAQPSRAQVRFRIE